MRAINIKWSILPTKKEMTARRNLACVWPCVNAKDAFSRFSPASFAPHHFQLIYLMQMGSSALCFTGCDNYLSEHPNLIVFFCTFNPRDWWKCVCAWLQIWSRDGRKSARWWCLRPRKITLLQVSPPPSPSCWYQSALLWWSDIEKVCARSALSPCFRTIVKKNWTNPTETVETWSALPRKSKWKYYINMYAKLIMTL